MVNIRSVRYRAAIFPSRSKLQLGWSEYLEKTCNRCSRQVSWLVDINFESTISLCLMSWLSDELVNYTEKAKNWFGWGNTWQIINKLWSTSSHDSRKLTLADKWTKCFFSRFSKEIGYLELNLAEIRERKLEMSCRMFCVVGITFFVNLQFDQFASKVGPVSHCAVLLVKFKVHNETLSRHCTKPHTSLSNLSFSNFTMFNFYSKSSISSEKKREEKRRVNLFDRVNFLPFWQGVDCLSWPLIRVHSVI